MKGIVEISERGLFLSVSSGWLLIRQGGNELGRIAFDDIEAILISEASTSLTSVVVKDCAERNIPIVFCDRSYKPCSITIPMSGNGFVTYYLYKQCSVSKVQMKHCWRELVRQKILNSAALLRYLGKNDSQLLKYARRVKSGDTKNMEAVAAKYFWEELDVFPKRDRQANDANCLFNYAYMVLFGMMARAICSAGLNPSLGINHHNKQNPFCLVSDLIEPYRYIAELAVIKWLVTTSSNEVTREAKLFLIDEIKKTRIESEIGNIPLFDGLRSTAVSYRDALEKDLSKIFLPKPLFLEVTKCG